LPTFQNGISPLERYGHNLTLLAQQGVFPPLTGYEGVVNQVFHILLRRARTNNHFNPVIVDVDGTMRKPVVAEIIRRMAVGKVPDPLPEQQVIALDYEALCANLSNNKFSRRRPVRPLPLDLKELDLDKPKSWAVVDELFLWPALEEWVAPNIVLERLQSIFIMMKQAADPILLLVDPLHRLLGGEWDRYPIDAFPLLKPALARGEVQLMGACTLAQYRQYIERDAAMQRRFQGVLLPDAQKDVNGS